MFKKMYPNGLLKDAINNRSILAPAMRFSHDRSSNSSNNDDDKITNTDSSSASTAKTTDNDNEQIPTPPNNCCMSGCANCVWIQYADEMSSKLENGSDVARDIIMNEMQDTNMRTFLEMELRLLKAKKDPK